MSGLAWLIEECERQLHTVISELKCAEDPREKKGLRDSFQKLVRELRGLYESGGEGAAEEDLATLLSKIPTKEAKRLLKEALMKLE